MRDFTQQREVLARASQDFLGVRMQAGLTVIELMVVLGIIAALVALGVPSFRQYRADQELRTVAREMSGIFHQAQANALATNTNHLVFLGNAPGAMAMSDICGNPLTDPLGNPVPVLVVRDDNGNCCFDAGEGIAEIQTVAGINWGSTFAPAGNQAPNDNGAGDHLTGSSFNRPNGVTQAFAVMFQGDGTPAAFDAVCTIGTVGSGNGGVYITNGNRDYAIVLSPLGAASVRRFERTGATWQ